MHHAGRELTGCWGQADSRTLREVRSCKLALSGLAARVSGISQARLLSLHCRGPGTALCMASLPVSLALISRLSPVLA